MTQLMEIPLWDNTIFQTTTRQAYRCPRLMRLGVYQVADMMKHGRVDTQKVLLLAPIWRGLYQETLEYMLRKRDEGKQNIILKGKEVTISQWKLKHVA